MRNAASASSHGHPEANGAIQRIQLAESGRTDDRRVKTALRLSSDPKRMLHAPTTSNHQHGTSLSHRVKPPARSPEIGASAFASRRHRPLPLGRRRRIAQQSRRAPERALTVSTRYTRDGPQLCEQAGRPESYRPNTRHSRKGPGALEGPGRTRQTANPRRLQATAAPATLPNAVQACRCIHNPAKRHAREEDTRTPRSSGDTAKSPRPIDGERRAARPAPGYRSAARG